MTKTEFLHQMKDYTANAVKDVLLPVRRQKGDVAEPVPRAADVHLMRLRKSSDAQKAAPYIIHQVITGKDYQPEGGKGEALAVVRSIFCVFNDDGQEGALSLLGLMERFRVAVLEDVVIANQFQLSLDGDGLEMLVYPDDTVPYYVGEMISTWRLPGVKRKVGFFNGY